MAKEKKVKKRKFRFDRANIIFIIGLLVLVIPIAFFGSVLFNAYVNTGKIFSGDRFKDDLNPSIKKGNLDNISADLKEIPQVKNYEVDLQTATLKVFLEFETEVSKNDIVSAIYLAYDVVLKELPIEDYFSASEGVKRQYDLEVQGFNLASEAEDFIYYIYKKSATAEEPYLQLVSSPVDPEYTEKILDHFLEQQTPVEDIIDEDENEGADE